jgi:hypothetical protein
LNATVILAAGSAAVGSVTVSSLPAIPAGSNAIGTVGVTALPALPAGANAIGSVSVSNFPGTQPVSGSVTAVQATGSNLHVVVDTAPTTAVTGTFFQATQPISAAALPLPSGASTAAKQPALGTAGIASTDVLTVQGIASMTPLKVDGSATTQPVSLTTLPALTAGSAVIGHVIADSGSTTAVTGNVTVTQATGTNLHVVVDSAPSTAVTGTVTANIGTSGSLALDASVTALQVSQGSTTSGQKGGLMLGAVTTAAPSYTTAQSFPLSLTTAGALRTDASATTQPVSGTVTVNDQTSGLAQTKITDGTTVANVGPASGSQTGATYLQVGATGQAIAFSASAAGNGTAIDVSGYQSISLQLIALYTGGTSVGFQGSNDNSNWQNVGLYKADGSSSTLTATSSGSGIWHGPAGYKWFRPVYNGVQSSGSTTGVIYLSTLPTQTSSTPVTQGGTWTIQQGSTPSATPWAFNPVATATGGYSFSNITTATTTTSKSGAGYLRNITVNTGGAGSTLTVYDNTAGSGTKIATIDTSTVGTKTYDIAFATGLTLVSASGTPADITVAWK